MSKKNTHNKQPSLWLKRKCLHNKQRSYCVECGGSGICEHKRQRPHCADCAPSSSFKTYIYNAKKRGHEFSLSFEEYLRISGSPCVYCGDQERRNGIDRKDNSIGYTVENSVSCCSKCNLMKRTYSVREFLSHIRKIYKFRKGN